MHAHLRPNKMQNWGEFRLQPERGPAGDPAVLHAPLPLRHLHQQLRGDGAHPPLHEEGTRDQGRGRSAGQ